MIDQLVAFQGEPGAYSEMATLSYFGADTAALPCRTFEGVFDSVAQRHCTHGVIPIENSLAGSIHRNYDLMLRNDLMIIGEYYLRVNHCLLALPGVSLDEITRVHSHPQALAQCEFNLARLGCQLVPEGDTAGSARLLVEKNDRQAAAVASRRAAQVYGLDILIEDLEDNPANFTRFLVLSDQQLPAGAADPDTYKTSIVFSLHNQPGVLFKALSVFALRDIDLTKIESRPLPGQLWEYIFYIDFIGSVQNSVTQRALDHLSELATFLRVLGSYPRHSFKLEEQP